MNWDLRAYNLSNIYWPLFTTSNQTSGKQSSLMTSQGQGNSLIMVLDENQTVTVPVSENSSLDIIKSSLD